MAGPQRGNKAGPVSAWLHIAGCAASRAQARTPGDVADTWQQVLMQPGWHINLLQVPSQGVSRDHPTDPHTHRAFLESGRGGHLQRGGQTLCLEREGRGGRGGEGVCRLCRWIRSSGMGEGKQACLLVDAVHEGAQGVALGHGRRRSLHHGGHLPISCGSAEELPSWSKSSSRHAQCFPSHAYRAI